MNGIIPDFRPLRVSILASKCGGHEMVAESVQKAVKEKFPNAIFLEGEKKLGEDYLVDQLWPMGVKGTSIHKKAVEGQWFRGLPIAVRIGLEIMKFKESIIKKTFCDYIDEKKPDIFISVVPIINAPLLKVAAEKKVPVFVIPTDGDNEIYSYNWPPPETPLFSHCYATPYSCIEIASRIHKNVDKIRVDSIGYGVRPEFLQELTPNEKSSIRNKLKIPEDKKTVLLMLGGSFGSNGNYHYIKNILDHDKTISPAHYEIFCGKQKEMVGKIGLLLANRGYVKNEKGHFEHPDTGATFSVLDFKTNVHEYLFVAHCIISKAGSGTFNEAIVTKVPIVLDDTVGCQPWERLNIDIAEQYDLGVRVSSFKELPKLINQMLDPKVHQEKVQSLTKFKEARPEQFKFAENVQRITSELLKEAQEAKSAPLNPTQPASTFLSTTQKVGIFILKWVFFPLLLIERILLSWFPYKLVQYGFFAAFVRTSITQSSLYKSLFPQKITLEDRRREMLKKGAIPIEGIISGTNTFLDAIRIPAKKENPNKNTVVFVLSKHYQNLHPENYEYMLEKGWDVVLFNPSESTSTAMSGDLKNLLKRLKSDHPNAKFAFNSYCIGAHVAAAVAADEEKDCPQDQPIALVIDRGFGDAKIAVENFIGIARQPPFKKMIEKDYNLKTYEKVHDFAGSVLFISPKDGKDALMHRGHRNLTKEFYELFPPKNRTWVTLSDTWDEEKKKLVSATHWSRWDDGTRDKVVDFIEGHFNPHEILNSYIA